MNEIDILCGSTALFVTRVRLALGRVRSGTAALILFAGEPNAMLNDDNTNCGCNHKSRCYVGGGRGRARAANLADTCAVPRHSPPTPPLLMYKVCLQSFLRKNTRGSVTKRGRAEDLSRRQSRTSKNEHRISSSKLSRRNVLTDFLRNTEHNSVFTDRCAVIVIITRQLSTLQLCGKTEPAIFTGERPRIALDSPPLPRVEPWRCNRIGGARGGARGAGRAAERRGGRDVS
ncbi:hypothetical protein EVAR_6668_1 [Eumeta japonica]|uniref:Uncharacterized protein n=1 Tax=Eumeta variegata TaxID=151549 RepID=A0A4C1TLT9_EUMVA|nr:hypothetical protein EVAR_6668_1 [Eumeta japonica]